MKYLCLLALRTVIANKRRSLVNIAVIALSVAMVVIVSSLSMTWIETQRLAILDDLPHPGSQFDIAQQVETDPAMGSMRIITIFLNTAMLVFAAFSIHGAFSAETRRQAKQMAVLTTLGATGLQGSLVTVMETVFLAVIGLPLGILLSLPTVLIINDYMMSICSTMHFAPPSQLLLDGEYVLKATLLSLATILLSALTSIVKASRRPLIDFAKSPSEIEISLKKSLLDYPIFLLFGKCGELASANYVNQKQNYRFLARSFSIAIILFVNGNLLISYLLQGHPAEGTAEGVRLLLEQLGFVISVLVFLASLNAFFMTESTFDRRRHEFAMWQSIGMDHKMIYKTVILEWLYRAIYIFGYTLMGSYLLNFITYSFMFEQGIANQMIHPIAHLLQAFFAFFLMTTVMTIVMITRIHRMNIVQALKESY